MAAETATSLCNIALTRIGAKEITSLENDQSREAVICRRLYHPARRTTLAAHYWNGAKRATSLTENTGVSPTFWDYAFTLPTDLIRLISVHPSDDINTVCEYALINANDTDADVVLATGSNQIYIQYVFDCIDIPIMSQGFRDVLCFVMARDLALALGKSTNKYELTNREYRRALTIAKSIDGSEDYPQRLAEGSWTRARSGLYSDTLIETS